MATATTKARTIPNTKTTSAKKDDTIVTVSPKYQIMIPKSVREQLQITPGDKLGFMVLHKQVKLVRVRPLEELIGCLKGVKIDLAEIRDEEDRF
jgi:AbrB family looped-hinge helix DNA binding protein